MGYRLTQAAKEDLRRIYAHGFEKWGEAAADQYYVSHAQYFCRLNTNKA